MPDLLFSVLVTRDNLGLADLDCNDHINYYIAAQFLGGTITWNRQQATSPFIDGSVTTYRSKQMVTENIAVEVLGDDITTLYANMSALVAAFTQDSFNLQVAIGSDVVQYACEAADYTVAWVGSRMVAKQVQVTFSMPRQPQPVVGGF